MADRLMAHNECHELSRSHGLVIRQTYVSRPTDVAAQQVYYTKSCG